MLVTQTPHHHTIRNGLFKAPCQDAWVTVTVYRFESNNKDGIMIIQNLSQSAKELDKDVSYPHT